MSCYQAHFSNFLFNESNAGWGLTHFLKSTKTSSSLGPGWYSTLSHKRTEGCLDILHLKLTKNNLSDKEAWTPRRDSAIELYSNDGGDDSGNYNVHITHTDMFNKGQQRDDTHHSTITLLLDRWDQARRRADRYNNSHQLAIFSPYTVLIIDYLLLTLCYLFISWYQEIFGNKINKLIHLHHENFRQRVNFDWYMWEKHREGRGPGGTRGTWVIPELDSEEPNNGLIKFEPRFRKSWNQEVELFKLRSIIGSLFWFVCS